MNQKVSKAERREQAREQARLARESEKKREKRNRLFLQGGIALVVIAVIGVAALVITQSMRPAGPGPQNMISGGVTFGSDLKVVETAALQDGEERKARDVDWTSSPIDVNVFVDYMCPGCGAFEQQHGTMFDQYVGSGDITLTIFPINFLDAQSVGSKYSTRAANALSCLVEQQPDFAFDYHNRLLSADVQPAQGTSGLTDDQLAEHAEAVGATADTEFRQCIKDQQFGSFISGNYKTVSETGIIGLAEGAQLMNPQTNELIPVDEPQRLMSTPTVIVNGQQWVQGRDGTLEEYILKLKAESDGNGAEEAEADAADADADAAAAADADAAAADAESAEADAATADEEAAE